MTAQTAEQRDLAAVIGLEVHVQLETATKIFCGCSTDAEADEEPNTRTCPVCLGLPGALPVLNEGSVEAAVKVGKALDADVPAETRFHRKNYYYPDLPKNFQITQYDAPICDGGELAFSVGGERRTVRIERAHLEEDPGSLTHAGGSIDAAEYTLVDYNRAGTPLLEIVTAPDFRSATEARSFLAKLTEVLEYLGVFDATRDGSLRVDANLSIVDAAEVDEAGDVDEAVLAGANRTEVKNISSHRGAEKALAYEETRQKNAVQRGREVEQETRHWDESRGITVSMRSKEAEKDYRYFREADLPPLRVSDWTERIDIPELPDARRERFREEYGLDAESASKLTSTKQVADFYERVAEAFDPDLAATWVADNLLGELNYRDMAVTDVEDRLEEFARLVELVDAGKITEKNAREVVLRSMLDKGLEPDAIVQKNDLGKTSFEEVEEAALRSIYRYLDTVDDFFEDGEEALNYLVGQIMQRTEGKADPQTINKVLRDRLAYDEYTDWRELSHKRKEIIALICLLVREDAFSRAELNDRIKQEFPKEYFDGLAVRTHMLNKLAEEDNYLIKIEQGGHSVFVQDIGAEEDEDEVVVPTPSNLKRMAKQIIKREGLNIHIDEMDIDWSSPSEVCTKLNDIKGDSVLLIRGAPNRYKLRPDIRNKIIHGVEFATDIEFYLPKAVDEYEQGMTSN